MAGFWVGTRTLSGTKLMHAVLTMLLCWLAVSLGTTAIWTCYCLWPRRREAQHSSFSLQTMRRF
jgi:hypothetical protein